jgi:hypothetical protein
MDIFETNPGTVVAIQTDATPFSLYVGNWGDYDGFKSIITGFEVQTQDGVQFMHSLQDFIYVYTFGERIGNISVSGISFFDDCTDPIYHGLEYVYGYYLANRTSERGAPISLVMGLSSPFYGFLVGLSMGLTDPDSMLGQFRMEFKTIPEPTILSIPDQEEDPPADDGGNQEEDPPADDGGNQNVILPGGNFGNG